MKNIYFILLIVTLNSSCKDPDIWEKKTETYSSGEKKSEYWIHNGLKDSTMITFDNKGNKTGELKFKNDKQEGETLIFYPSGKISEKQFYKNGKREGLFLGFHENGNKKMEISFEDDKIAGIFRKWDEKGAVIVDTHIAKDSLKFIGQHVGIGGNKERK
jgi:antitoxin component YwqK of YwqJK toxin-antitoxin module